MKVAPTDAQIDAIIAGYREDRARPARAEARPFLIVTPLGRPREVALRRALDRLHVTVKATHPLREWPRLATALYTPRADRSRMTVAFGFAQAWQQFAEPAAVWWLYSAGDHGRLIAAKSGLRVVFPSQRIRIESPVGVRDAELHAFHVPDRERLAAEQAIVAAYVSA